MACWNIKPCFTLFYTTYFLPRADNLPIYFSFTASDDLFLFLPFHFVIRKRPLSKFRAMCQVWDCGERRASKPHLPLKAVGPYCGRGGVGVAVVLRSHHLRPLDGALCPWVRVLPKTFLRGVKEDRKTESHSMLMAGKVTVKKWIFSVLIFSSNKIWYENFTVIVY